jgi:hypothetical protein
MPRQHLISGLNKLTAIPNEVVNAAKLAPIKPVNQTEDLFMFVLHTHLNHLLNPNYLEIRHFDRTNQVIQ